MDAVRVEVWRRDAGWAMHMLGPDDAIALPELEGTLSVAEIDARVDF